MKIFITFIIERIKTCEIENEHGIVSKSQQPDESIFILSWLVNCKDLH